MDKLLEAHRPGSRGHPKEISPEMFIKDDAEVDLAT